MWQFYDSENKRGLDLNDLEKSRYHLSEVDEKHALRVATRLLWFLLRCSNRLSVPTRIEHILDKVRFSRDSSFTIVYKGLIWITSSQK